jgi:hypothetical protein
LLRYFPNDSEMISVTPGIIVILYLHSTYSVLPL